MKLSLNSLPHWLLLILPTAVTAVLLLYFLQTELSLTGGQLGVPLDDAWIHYQFARNLSQGQGFSYNPGQPTPGSTAPLWTLLLAGVGIFTEDFLVPSLLLSAGFLLTAVWLSYGFTFDLTKNHLAGLLAALAVAVSGRFLWAGLAGMETTAFAALSLAAVWVYWRMGLRPLAVVLFGLASQMRPEGHALFALAVADSLLAWRWPLAERSTPFNGRLLLISLAIYGAIAAPYVVFSLATTGHPLPNTFYAKVGSQFLFSLRTLRETLAWHFSDNPIAFILIPMAIGHMWRHGRLALGWLIGLPLLTAVIIDFTWHHGRYTMPLIPFQMITAAVGAWVLAQKMRPTGRQLMMPLMALVLLGGGLRVPFWGEMLSVNTKEVLDIDVALGRWLAVNTPTDALLAVDDIGAITFVSQRRIVDLNGLVSPEMWTAVRTAEGLPRNQVMTRLLSDIQPDYMVSFPLWRWEIATNPNVAEPIHHVQTETHTIIFQQDAYVYRMTWPYVTEAMPENGREAVLGEAIRLLGYDLMPPVDNQSLRLTLYWQSLAPVSADYDVFVHVLDANGELVAQVDQQPLQGLAATHLWQPGDVVRDPYQLTLPPEQSADAYTIQVGMYLRQTGERLSAVGEQVHENAIVLTEFTIDQ